MRDYYLIGGCLYTELELKEFELESSDKEAVYRCTDDTLDEEYVTTVIGDYHYGINMDLNPEWLIRLY